MESCSLKEIIHPLDTKPFSHNWGTWAQSNPGAGGVRLSVTFCHQSQEEAHTTLSGEFPEGPGRWAGSARSEDHCPKALMECLPVAELNLGAWAQCVWKTFKVQSGSNHVLQGTGTRPAVHPLPCCVL